jgi:hypothetical protein
MNASKKTSNVVLILANLVPLAGVLFLGWDGKGIIVVYILETVMIGIINALKMLTVYFINGTENEPKENPKAQGVSGLGLVPFFLFHYNFFIFVQSVLFFAFSSMWEPMGKGPEPFNVIANFALYINQETAWALGSLLIANLTYLINDFILNDGYKTQTMAGLMFAPYKRIFLQQFLVILGGFVFILTGGIGVVMGIFVLLKTGADYISANYGRNPKVKSWVEQNIMKDKDGKPLSEDDREAMEKFLKS